MIRIYCNKRFVNIVFLKITYCTVLTLLVGLGDVKMPA